MNFQEAKKEIYKIPSPWCNLPINFDNLPANKISIKDAIASIEIYRNIYQNIYRLLPEIKYKYTIKLDNYMYYDLQKIELESMEESINKEAFTEIRGNQEILENIGCEVIYNQIPHNISIILEWLEHARNNSNKTAPEIAEYIFSFYKRIENLSDLENDNKKYIKERLYEIEYHNSDLVNLESVYLPEKEINEFIYPWNRLYIYYKLHNDKILGKFDFPIDNNLYYSYLDDYETNKEKILQSLIVLKQCYILLKDNLYPPKIYLRNDKDIPKRKKIYKWFDESLKNFNEFNLNIISNKLKKDLNLENSHYNSRLIKYLLHDYCYGIIKQTKWEILYTLYDLVVTRNDYYNFGHEIFIYYLDAITHCMIDFDYKQEYRVLQNIARDFFCDFSINQSDKRNLIKEKIIPRIEAIINNNDLDSMLVYFIMMVKDASISYIYDQDYESYLKDILAEDY